MLVGIETDKAQMDFEGQEEGYIAKILMEGGQADVPVNTPLAVICEEKEDIPKFADFVLKPEEEESPTVITPAPEASPSISSKTQVLL